MTKPKHKGILAIKDITPNQNEAIDEWKIQAIKDRLAQATAGNWYFFLEGRDHSGGSSFIMTNVENRDDWRNPNRGEDLEISGATHADNEFIANARQDIPMLLAEIERLKALVK